MYNQPVRSKRWATGLFVAVLLVQARAAHAGEDDLTLDLGASALELRRIPKGTFVQGSPATEPGRDPDESEHPVTISRPFWIGRVPVTRSQFSRFVTETRFVTDAEKNPAGGFGWEVRGLVQKKEYTWRNPGFPQKDEDPVVLVSFADANAFVAWASKKSGRRVRLPTEAEWEYAARAGTTTPWFGAGKEDEALALGWFKPNARYTTHPVGSKRANAFGLFDMTGNVFEWCRDAHAPYPAGPVTDPDVVGPAAGEPERRVLRGGSWLRDAKRGRSAARHKGSPGTRNAETGFRVAMDDDVDAGAGRDDMLPPGLGTSTDFAPASPVGMTEEADASSAPQPVVAPRPTNEGSGWSLLGAPFAGAALAVAWVLARRRLAYSSVTPAPPVATPRSLPPVAPSVPPPSMPPAPASIPAPASMPPMPASIPAAPSGPPAPFSSPSPPSARMGAPPPPSSWRMASAPLPPPASTSMRAAPPPLPPPSSRRGAPSSVGLRAASPAPPESARIPRAMPIESLPPESLVEEAADPDSEEKPEDY